MFDCNHITEVLATSFFETISPTRCVVCDEPGQTLCSSCAAQLPYIDLSRSCKRCGAPYGHVLCTECPIPGSEEALNNPEGALPFAGVRAALSYERGTQKVLRTYKDGDELRLDRTIASFVCQAMRGRTHGGRVEPAPKRTNILVANPYPADWTQWADAIVCVPATDDAIRRRGFDHMERIGRICSERTGLPLHDALACTRRTLDQRDLGREMRFENRGGSFAVKRKAKPLPNRIILIDDVFTTGATCSAAAKALLDGGAGEVAVAVCARVW